MRLFPRSLLLLVAAGLAMILQAIPIIGIFLMFLLAPLWSVVLVNLAMLGTAWEALGGQVGRWWLILPLLFYGGYYAFFLAEQVAIARLRAENSAANADVHVPFDPRRHVLVATTSGEEDIAGEWLVQNFALPVFYERNANYPEGHRATRLADAATCARIRGNRALSAAGIHAFGFHDEDGRKFGGRFENRFCLLSQPERPALPTFRIAQVTTRSRIGTMPARRTVTTIRSPNGQAYRLRGGGASPLRWFPMPYMGCGLNSGAAKWECGAGFLRAFSTPLVDTRTEQRSDPLVLAQALGLRRIAPSERRGADSRAVTDLVARAEAAALASDIAQFDRVVADPAAKIDSVPFRVLASRPDALEPRAERIMLGLEQAVRVGAPARDNGRELARLLTRIAPARFVGFGPRILAFYRGADEKHWLWEADYLVDRFGDLGPAALPLLVRSAHDGRPASLRSIEAACRLGPAARPLATMLRDAWIATTDFDRDARAQLFVAMRRIGVAVPPLRQDPRGHVARLIADWSDVGPLSPRRVCAVREETQARREEKYGGRRRTNLF